MELFTFERLDVWQKSRMLVKDVYALISKFPTSEKFGLSSQLGRAIISVPSNIAEGCCRISLKERAHFYEIAYGSLMESVTQLILAVDLNYIAKNEYDIIKSRIVEVAKMISGIRKSTFSKANS